MRINLGWLTLILVLTAGGGTATGQTVEYYHVDALGSVRAITDGNGAVVGPRYDYLPFGEETAAQTSTNTRRFTGKERDGETGLDYFGARYYRSDIGRFTTIDPVYTWSENLEDPQRWNRYAYARNNPLKYVDPDGRAIDTIFDIASVAYDLYRIAREGATRTNVLALGADVGAAVIPFATGAGAAVRAAARTEEAVVAGERLVKGGSEVVQRAMSKAELAATKETGLLRGGREGTHYVSDAVNSSANRARQRLSLPQTPEVKVTVEVPAGTFGPPTRVQPNFNMPGGGMERTATGRIPVKILKSEEMK